MESKVKNLLNNINLSNKVYEGMHGADTPALNAAKRIVSNFITLGLKLKLQEIDVATLEAEIIPQIETATKAGLDLKHFGIIGIIESSIIGIISPAALESVLLDCQIWLDSISAPENFTDSEYKCISCKWHGLGSELINDSCPKCSHDVYEVAPNFDDDDNYNDLIEDDDFDDEPYQPTLESFKKKKLITNESQKAITDYTGSIIDVVNKMLNLDYHPTGSDYEIDPSWDDDDLKIRLEYTNEYLSSLPSIKGHLEKVKESTLKVINSRKVILANKATSTVKTIPGTNIAVKEPVKEPIKNPVEVPKVKSTIFSAQGEGVEKILKMISAARNIREMQTPYLALIKSGAFSIPKEYTVELIQLAMNNINAAKEKFFKEYEIYLKEKKLL